MKRLLSFFLPVLSLPVLSRIYGRLVRFRRPRFLIKRWIRFFQRVYGIEMTEYQGETDDYKSLSDFFIRPLDPARRTLVQAPDFFVAPADGVLSSVQTVREDRVTQVKGKDYRLSRLLMEETLDFSAGWHVAVIYLAPFNYHRYHFPCGGTVGRYFHAGNRLFPVNTMGLNYVKELFVRNERVIVRMETRGMPCYLVAVGATFVGSIKMEFLENPMKSNQWIPVNREVAQLEEMGRFEMGSTIVMVMPEPLARPIESLQGQAVRAGQPIFKF